MKFSFEVPFKHLKDFDDLQDFVFTLSIHYQDQRFVDYVTDVRRKGLKTIWLDNSFNEKFEADDPEELIHLYKTYDLQKVIVPDAIDWPTERLCESFRYLDGRLPTHSLISVVNSVKCYQALRELGAQHFAVSYWVRESFRDLDLQRIPNLHFLGLLSVTELHKCRPASVDTSMPIKLALRGKNLSEWASEGYPHINTKDLGTHGRDFFQTEMTYKQIELARYNIETLKRAVRGL